MRATRWGVATAGAAIAVIVAGGVALAYTGQDDDPVRVPGVQIGAVSGVGARAPGVVTQQPLPGPAAVPAAPAPAATRAPAATPEPVAAPEQVARAAEAAVGPGARAVEVKSDDDGPKAWEVEVIGADGAKREVELDRSGGVLRVHRDD